MFRTRYIKSLMIAAAAVAAACTADPVDPTDPEGTDPNETPEPASLTINFSIADLGVDVSTRAAGDLLGNDEAFPADGVGMLSPDYVWKELDPWSPPPAEGQEDPRTPEQKNQNIKNYRMTEAALIEGSAMSCLTVILVNYKENRIVAVRRIPDPDCPNHDVSYTGDGGVQSYPPPEGPEREKAKKNCILVKKADGTFDLAPVLRDENGAVVIDNPEDKHIMGLAGTHACVTFEYENPIHVVKEGEFAGQSAEKLTRGEYTILVVANYDHRVTTASITDQDGVGSPTMNVDKQLEDLVNMFHQPQYMAKGIYPFSPVAGVTGNYAYLYDLRFLMNRTLQGDNYTLTNVGPFTDIEGNNVKPYIRPAVHQTLSAAKDIYLEAGNNVINIELQRISSRTRVEVKNYAGIPLKVHSLKFSPNYTQSSCYLFRRNKNDRDYTELATPSGKYSSTYHPDHDGKGAPMVNYTGIHNYYGGKTYGAIVPFIKDWDTDSDDVKDGIKVEPGAKECIFDALMYESHLKYKDEDTDPDSFTYTIEVSYPDVTNYETPDINKIDYDKWVAAGEPQRYDPERAKFDYAKTKDGRKDFIHDPATPEALHTSITALESGLNKDESLCFLIQGASVNKFLREKEGGIMYADLADVDLNTEAIDLKAYLWVMDELELKDGKCYCYLKNLRSGKYMSVVTESSWPIENSCIKTTAEKPAEKCNVTIGTITRVISKTESYVEHNVMFSNTGSTSFLNIWGGQNYLGGYEDSNDPGSQYRLYPIKLSPTLVYIGTPWMRKEVELTAFSDKTGFVEKVNEIKRNDFIRILVEVSYNPDKSDFDFKVNSWKTGGGNIDFH